MSSTVGPEAMRSKGSPSTSDMISAMSQPARHARASPPPLMRLSCLRTVLSCSIFAPAALKCRVTASLSASLIPTTGAGRSAEPPPEMTARQRSRGESEPTRSRIAAVPATPASVGSLTPGGRAPCSRIRSKVRTQSSGTLTQPVNCFSAASREPSASSIAAAMPAPALPPPTTTMRPIESSSIRSSPTTSTPPSTRSTRRTNVSARTGVNGREPDRQRVAVELVGRFAHLVCFVS